jgi:hypothetical protein
MVYMFLALQPALVRRGPAPGMPAMSASGSRLPVLALCLLGYVVRVSDRLPRRALAFAASGPGSGPLAPAAPPWARSPWGSPWATR